MIPLKDDVPVQTVPVLTIGLIAANVLAFLWQLDFGLERSVLVGGAIPYEILTFRDVGPLDLVPPPLTVITSMFLHGGLLHIGGNMLFLWIFGNNIEDALGRSRFLIFYLACGIAAAASQTAASVVSGEVAIPMVGASGAIAGVLAAYLVFYPYARVLTLVPIFIFIRLFYIPAWFFIGLWFVVQLLSGLLGGGGSGVAFFAHIGGFATGFVLAHLMGRRRGWRRYVR